MNESTQTTALVPGPSGSPLTESRFNSTMSKQTLTGFAFGGGVEKKIGPLRLTADARWTFWSDREPLNFGGGIIQTPTPLLILGGIGF